MPSFLVLIFHGSESVRSNTVCSPTFHTTVTQELKIPVNSYVLPCQGACWLSESMTFDFVLVLAAEYLYAYRNNQLMLILKGLSCALSFLFKSGCILVKVVLRLLPFYLQNRRSILKLPG